MKRKDMIYLLLAVVIFLVAGYVGYTQLIPHKASATANGVQVENVGSIPSTLSGSGLTLLGNPTKARDFQPPSDFSGLGNAAPFGP
jgi:hypothetical protein